MQKFLWICGRKDSKIKLLFSILSATTNRVIQLVEDARMPFCINCGTFESMLKPRDLCQSCFGSLKETEFIKDEIESKRKNIKTELNYPILSYLHDLFPHQKYAGRQTGGIFGFLENLA